MLPHPIPQQIYLRPFIEMDVPGLIGWITSPLLLIQWAGPGHLTYPLTAAQLSQFLSVSTEANEALMAFSAINEEGGICGHVQLGAINAQNQTASLCRVMVAPDTRGTGCCQRIVREALRLGFMDLDLRRIQLNVYSFNEPAIRCYTSAGFVKEGLLRKSLKVGSEFWDTVVMAVLKEEWDQLQPSGGKPQGSS